mmetsp:Transcript_100731/g.307961  ORF Transcript_100731/g.307961 Transcript_100731/m.307961 type:complete len:407 (-) Transcript_100731:1238-2458(-)
MELVIGVIVQVRSLADVVHLRRHDDALAAPGQLGRPHRRRRGALGQAPEEGLQGAVHPGEQRLVRGDVGDARPLEDALLQLPQLGLDRRPVLLRELHQVPERLVLAEASNLLVRPAGGGQLPAQAGARDRVAGGEELRAAGGLGLPGELHEALLVLPARLGGDLRHEVQQVVHLVGHGLPAHDQVRHRVRGAPLRRDERRGADAARGEVDPALQLDEVRLLRAHLAEAAAEERQQRQQPPGDAPEVEGEVHVDDARGQQRVPQHLRAAEEPRLGGHLRGLLGDVGDVEARHRRQGLGRVRLLLQLLQLLGRVDEGLDVALAERGLVLLEAGLLLLLDARALLRARLGGHGEAVRVLEQALLQHALEDLLLVHDQLLPQGFDRRIVPQALEGILPVVPIVHSREHER